ncbi:MAG: UvrB/UvrC motif-containing protein [Clostridia bacterium]|nr:UvrB/UvrC motif-containing protein [Clostridia bacterium]
MLCQSCGENMANTHIKRVINGEVKEYMLCEECAKKMGYGKLWSDFSLDFDNFLGSFFTENIPHRLSYDTLRCKNCGSSFEDISNTGKVGCAKCYTVFYDQLVPSIKRIHGNTKHVGKMAANVGKEKKVENELQDLNIQLKKAIEKQEFEKAAELRDRIKELSKGAES